MRQVASVSNNGSSCGQPGDGPGDRHRNDRNAGKEKQFIFAKDLRATFTNAAVN